MEFLDKTGTLRSDHELQEALDAINQLMIKHPLALPLFTVYAGVFKDALKELQQKRTQMQELSAWLKEHLKDGYIPSPGSAFAGSEIKRISEDEYTELMDKLKNYGGES